MRVSQEEKERSRSRIVTAAARLFRERGVQGASVGDIMSEAGLTHGGFYRHFPDKDALLAEALTAAFDRFTSPLLDGSDPVRDAAAFRALYLSDDHRGATGQGCPAAALGPDIARSGDAVRQAFSGGIDTLVAGLARGKEMHAQPRTDAMRDLAMMVGAMVLARGAGGTLADEILTACAAPPAAV